MSEKLADLDNTLKDVERELLHRKVARQETEIDALTGGEGEDDDDEDDDE